VRGQPAFDIAEQAKIGEADGWIVSTSGHRAYPVWAEPLEHFVQYVDGQLMWISDKPSFGYGSATCDLNGIRDHYEPKAAPPKIDILTVLDIKAAPEAPFKRRF
jgi:hypothetical protein